MHLHLEFRWGGGSLAQPQLGAVQATFRGLVNFECALRGEKGQVQSLVISHKVTDSFGVVSSHGKRKNPY